MLRNNSKYNDDLSNITIDMFKYRIGRRRRKAKLYRENNYEE